MATQTVERLIASLEARTKEYEKGLARAQQVTVTKLRAVEREIDSHTTRSQRLFDRFGTSIANSLKAALAGVTIAGAARYLKTVISDVADLADNARRASVDFERFQEILFAGQLEGAAPEKLIDAMQKLNIEIGEALNGTNDLGKLFEANNISIRSGNGEVRTTLELLLEVADLVKNAANDFDRMVILEKTLGRGARDLLPFFMQGAEAIREQMTAAKETGAVIDREMVARAKEFDDHLKAAAMRMDAMAKSSLMEFMDGLVDKANGFAGAMARAGNSSVFQRMRDFLGIDPAEAQRQFNAAQGGPVSGASRSARGKTLLSNTGAKGDRTTVIPDFGTPERPDIGEINRASQAFDRLREVEAAVKAEQAELNDLVDTGRDTFKGFFEDLRSGVSAADAMKNALERLSAKLMDLALDKIFNMLIGQTGVGSMFAPGVGPGGMGFAHFGGPRAHGGPVDPGKVYRVGEHGEEAFVPNVAGRIIPNTGMISASGPARVVVNNYGPPIAATVSQSSDGREIRLMIEEQGAKMIADRTSKWNTPLSQRGAKNQLKRR